MLWRLLALLSFNLGLLIIGIALVASPAVAAQPAPAASLLAANRLQTFDCANVTEIPQNECAALVALYQNTNGSNWYDSTGWLQSTTPCSWTGVYCAIEHVKALDLEQNLLVGPIPPELGQLTALQSLVLGENQITGAIPPELGHATALQWLDLRHNQLCGEIPPQEGDLAALKFLGLDHNQLSGAIPPQLGNLTILQVLGLSYNHLSGPIPPELGNLAAVVSLYLNNNHLSGPIPPELGNLVALQRQPSASGLPDEWVLPFQYADDGTIRPRVNRSGPFAVMRPPPLYFTAMDLSSNQLSGPIPAELGKLRGLDGIDLSGNQLSGAPPAQVMLGFAYWWRNYQYNLLTIPDDPYYIYDYRTQTVPPTDLQVARGLLSADLTWTPIPYTGDGGYYEISYSRWPDGPFLVHGRTADKTAASYTITGLPPDDVYYFRVRTFTPAHTYTEPDFRYFDNDFMQQSDLWSDYSVVVSTSSETPTPTATATASATVTSTVTAIPTETPTVTASATPSATPTPTVTWIPTATATLTVTPTPSVTPTATPHRRWLPLIWR